MSISFIIRVLFSFFMIFEVVKSQSMDENMLLSDFGDGAVGLGRRHNRRGEWLTPSHQLARCASARLSPPHAGGALCGRPLR